MAVRKPLYYVSNNLKEMSTSMVDEIVSYIVHRYGSNPSVTLSYVSSGGNLGTISDTRKKAGAKVSRSDRFPTESETPEPGTVTVNYSRINSATASTSATADTGKTFPVYVNSSNQIQAMTLTDVKDTFLHPAIDLLTSGSTGTSQAGTYHISTSTSVSGSTIVDSNPVFSDTRANTSAYTAGGIPETLDQPTTITNYYLHKIDAGSAPSFTLPFVIDSNNNLQQMTTSNFNTLYDEWIRETAASSSDGYSISYNLGTSGSGNTRGSGMGDTRLNGSGNRQTRQVGDDYRAQEFPNGSATTVNTYFLRINKS